jgi:hypothetical protein
MLEGERPRHIPLTCQFARAIAVLLRTASVPLVRLPFIHASPVSSNVFSRSANVFAYFGVFVSVLM